MRRTAGGPRYTGYMSRSYEEVREQALALTVEERSWLADDLIESNRTDEERAIAQAWIAEAQRRLAEIDSGKVKPVPAEEVHERVRARLRAARRAASRR